MKMQITGGYGKFDRRVRQFRSIPKRAQTWAERHAALTAEIYKEKLSTQGRAGGEGPPLAESTIERYEREGYPDGSAIYNHVRVVTNSTPNGVLASMEIPNEGDAPTPATLARMQDRGAIITTPTGGHIVMPGRRSWELTLSEVVPAARQELKQLLKLKR
jgi:hypothetical protein